MPRPKTDTVKKSIVVPSTLWVEIEKLAPSTPAELAARLVERGLRVYQAELAAALELELNELEKSNKILVNQKLRQRQGKMTAALEQLKEIVGENPGAAEAIAALEKGLSD
ncbi:MAG: hypothetical protein AAFV85_23170 [Cyanobacteria bacterium J06634_6]